MIASSEFIYTQVRLQARYGERLQDADWRSLDAIQSLPRYLDRCRSTALRRYSERLSAAMSSHAIEAALRREAQRAVREVAAWMPAAWRPAAQWFAVLPLLPLIDGLLRTEVPRGSSYEEPFLVAMAAVDAPMRRSLVEESAYAPLVGSHAGSMGIADLWSAHWKKLWPGGEGGNPALAKLASEVGRVVAAINQADAGKSSRLLRGDIDRICVRFFRRHSSTPTAAFAYLGLVFIDIERFRGGAVRRALFIDATCVKEAA
jgi:hypothetical protein